MFGDPKHEIFNGCFKVQKGDGGTSQTILGPNQPYTNLTDPFLTLLGIYKKMRSILPLGKPDLPLSNETN